MTIDYEELRLYKDRIRIFFIIYFFSEIYNEQQYSDCCRVLHTEVKIQKLDFLIRNPDYLCYELLDICNRKDVKKEEIKTIVKNIFCSHEPQIRRLEMEKFFFGAYEDIDQVIAFLVTVGFIKYTTERNSVLRPTEKSYYITNEADLKMKRNMDEMPYLQWYIDRCLLIKKYFGEYSGTELKNLQYKIDEYRDTTYKEYIQNVEEKVKIKYFEEFGEEL
ncbi:hypothetical protein F9653_13040 [Listeria monocytogenes]|uniref:Uncharacterized protein n=1 Tax=Listeria monocytogenes TaxID=1639 RepID=A0A5M2PZ12_LISMN|nr:hypothetical protein [Listeria monocytogenes]EGI5444546.1 hypothetical protein [Listeria monocytogenes]